MRSKSLVTLLVTLAFVLSPTAAQAGGVVRACDETHLRAALAGGGTVTFTCSGTITLASTISPAANTNTTIDGSGQTIIISGNNDVRVFRVNSGVTLNLNKLTVANGAPLGSGGGGIYNSGTLTVNNSNLSNNSTPDVQNGGAICNMDSGTLTVSNSTFSDNTNGGIFNRGILKVNSGNFSGNGRSGIYNEYPGTTTASNSTFSGNTNGIYNESQGTTTVSNSSFSGNTNGGIFNIGILEVNSGNFSANSNGGIVNHGELKVNSSNFFANDGCGIAGGGLTVNYSTFSANNGCGIGGGDLMSSSIVSNSTFSGNRGGGIQPGPMNSFTVSNSTFSGNSYGILVPVPGQGPSVTLQNTIVANSSSGTNCSAAPWEIRDGGGNLSYPDTTCPGINGDPRLGPLQNNGGPTQTMALLPGSAALDAGNDAICAAAPVDNRDQRGVLRTWGPHCDIGAYEMVQASDFVYLPVIAR